MTSASNNGSPLATNVSYGHDLGWSFTPLAGKVPTRRGWQKAPREDIDEALVWAAAGNVGLRTGRASGIVVLDVDPGGDVSGLDLPATVRANTGREGGYHLYYHCGQPVGNSTGSRLGPHIDVKGDGGQVVFPGSVHPDTDRPYAWAEGCEPWNCEVAELPEAILQRLIRTPRRLPPPRPKSLPSQETPVPTEKPPNDRAARYAQTAMKLELNALCVAEEGNRNKTLNRAAFSLGQLIGGGYLERDEVEAALQGAAGSVGLKPVETDRTIRSGIESGIRKPRTIELRRPDGRRSDYLLLPGPHKDDQDHYVEQSTATFADEVLDHLPDEAIYRKDFIPGEILGRTGRRKWVEFGADRMRIVVDTHCRLGKWVTSRKSKEQVLLYQPASRDAAGVVIAQARQAAGIRELDLMVAYPIYGADWKRIAPGFADGLYYDEPPELRDLRPETDCEVIHNVLHDLVVDFPFKSEADRQNFFGLLLTPIVGPALDGNRPMHLVNSPLERTGKTKLVNEILGGVLVGREIPAMQITEREEEREKRILAMLLQGETLMHLDNLPHYLDSTSLSSLLTAHVFGGRVLGVSRTVKLANHLTLVGTGNNVAASGEIAKRIVPIMIEPTSAHPESRKDFQHADLRAYVRKHRRTVLECLLGLVENWLAAGRPRHPNRFGGFESWSETVGGILQVNALRKWRTNEADWRRLADPRGAEMEAFVEAWHEAHSAAEATPKELRDLAQQNELFGYIFARRSEQAINVAFGRMLHRHADQPVGKWFIRRTPFGHTSRYRLEEIQ